MKYTTITIIFVFLINTLCFSQSKIDSSQYIESHYNKLIISILDESHNNSLKYKINKDELDYFTNVPSVFGVGLQYKWLRLKVNFLNGNTFRLKNKPPTDNFSFRINICSPKWVLSYLINNFNGYYLEINKNYNDQGVLDVKLNSNFINFLYYFNADKYSYKTSLFHSERQLRSAGSIVTGFSLTHDKVDFGNDKTLSQYLNKEVNDYRNLYLTYKIGYAHTFAICKRFHIALSAIPAISFQRGKLNFKSEEESTSRNVNFLFSTMFSLGYNTDKYFFGFDLHTRNKLYNFGDFKHLKSDLFFSMSVSRKFDLSKLKRKRK